MIISFSNEKIRGIVSTKLNQLLKIYFNEKTSKMIEDDFYFFKQKLNGNIVELTIFSLKSYVDVFLQDDETHLKHTVSFNILQHKFKEKREPS